jgi:hypothetical protein
MIVALTLIPSISQREDLEMIVEAVWIVARLNNQSPYRGWELG